MTAPTTTAAPSPSTLKKRRTAMITTANAGFDEDTEFGDSRKKPATPRQTAAKFTKK